jgi:hypothetical protein
MQELHSARSGKDRLKTMPMCMRALVTATLVMGAAIGSPSGVHAEAVKESPLVSCMVRKASPQIRETVANAAQEDVYCPPAQLQPTQAACPPAENYRALIKRAVFDLAKECSKEFPIRESLPAIEEAFMANLHANDAIKDTITKRKMAYEKSKADFEKTQAASTALTTNGSSAK